MGLLLQTKRALVWLGWLVFVHYGTAEAAKLFALHPAPSFRQAPAGSSLDFSCEVNDPSASVRLWHMLNWGSMYTPTENVVRNGQKFTRHQLKQNARGTYFCKAYSSNGQRLTIRLGQVWISPAPKDPPLPKVRSMQIATVGENANISCTATGNTISAIQWFKHGARITEGKELITHQGIETKIFTNTMQLTKFEKNGTYMYECRVFTDNKTSWFWAARTLLRVQDSPLCPKNNKSSVGCVGGVSTRKKCSLGLEWNNDKKECLRPALRWASKQTTSLIRKKSGESHTFDCRLNDPSVRVMLMTKASRSSRQRRPDGCKITRAGQVFTVHALQIGVDQGVYSCDVLGVRMIPRNLGILYVLPRPHKIVKHLIAPVGSSVDLDCAGYDIPQPMLSLHLLTADGHSTTITPDGKNVVQNNQVFTINSLGPDMRGSVQCRVKSSCSRMAKSVDIGYLLPMPNTRPPPNPTIQPSVKTAYPDDNVTFTCSASGDQLEEFLWYRNTDLITSGISRVSNTSSALYLGRVSSSSAGIYRCRIKGAGVGYWVDKAELKVKFKEMVVYTVVLDLSVVRVVKPLFDEITVSCKLNATYLQVELLQKKSGKLIPRPPDGVKVVLFKQVFTIRQLRYSDEGLYLCSAAGVKPFLKLDLRVEPPMTYAHVMITPVRETLDFLGDINFICYSNISYGAVYSWMFQNSKGILSEIPLLTVTTINDLPGRSDRYVISTLHIRNVTQKDSGTYICQGRAKGRIWNASAQLTVKALEKPNITQHSTSVILREREVARLWCHVKPGSPLPIVSWRQNGKIIGKCSPAWKQFIDCPELSGKYKVFAVNNTYYLKIANITFPEDSGTYSCVVQNEAGTEETSMSLNILTKPRLQNQTSNPILAKKKWNVTLQCEVEQSNPASISWWYQSCPLDNATCEPQTHVWSDLQKTSNQVVVGPRDEHALYMCIAQNSIGNDSKEFVVLRFDLKPPRIQNFLPQVTVNSSQNVKLVCKVDGTPLPDVIWTKDGKHVGACSGQLPSLQKTCGPRQGAGARYRVSWTGSGSELFVENAIHPFDAGKFTCSAVSPHGRDNATVTITIQEKPVLRSEASLVRLPFHAAKTLRLNAVQGHPEPQFKWYFQPIRGEACVPGKAECQPNPATWRRVRRDTFAVSPPNETPARASSIFIPPLKREFFYRCTAENPVGKDDVTFSVYRYYSPDEILPKISTTPSGGVVDEEDELTITCEGDLFEMDALTWERPGLVAVPVASTKAMTKSINITIKAVRPSDAGVYGCVGWTMNDTKSAQVIISVKALVVPRVSLMNQTLKEEETNETSLHCSISAGYPRPEVTWFRNGHKLEPYPLALGEGCRYNGFYHKRGDKSVNSEHLVICKPRHADNTGWYECRAKNKRGGHSAKAYLDVTASPIILNLQEGTSEHEVGGKFIKTCKATGNPEPSVRWIKKSKNKHIPVVHGEEQTGVLRIDELREEDFGEYVCVAENELGNSTASLAIVHKSHHAAVRSNNASSKTHIIIAIATSTVLAIILIILILILVRRRQLYGGVYICSTPPRPDIIDTLDPSLSLYEQVHKLPYDENWEFPREQLHLKHILGSGAFGAVYYAEADSAIISDSSSSSVGVRHKLVSLEKRRLSRRRSSAVSLKGPSKVAVKTLKEGAGEAEYKDLVSELKILIHVGAHVNIVNLLGACTKGRKYDICVIMEYCPHGNLLKFLRSRRESYKPEWLPRSDQDEGSLCLESLVSCAYQVARAMEFLASRKCVHRDLAARNVLVGDDYVMKVADFGMARDVYKNDQYVKQSTGLVPVKWMAIESLTDNFYSQKSDVWSFGVLLWEMLTLGGNPYPNVPPTEVYQFLAEGRRMDRPVDCPEFIHTMMLDCWLPDAEDRPVFTELVKRLEHVIESNMGKDTYLELNENVLEATEVDGYLQPVDGAAPFAKIPSSAPQSKSETKRVAKLAVAGEKQAEESPNQLKVVDLRRTNRYTELGVRPSHHHKVPETIL